MRAIIRSRCWFHAADFRKVRSLPKAPLGPGARDRAAECGKASESESMGTASHLVSATVLDETLEVGREIQAILAAREAKATLIGTAGDFRQSEEARDADLLIVNLGGRLTPNEVVRL